MSKANSLLSGVSIFKTPGFLVDSIGISSWNWQFENSLGEGSNKYEGYCYNNAGIYDVKLIVENVVGCFDTVESLGLG